MGLLGSEENLEFQLYLGEPIKWHEFEKTKRAVSGIILPSKAESKYRITSSAKLKNDEEETNIHEQVMFGVKGWIEGLSTHIWLRACINGLGVSKKMNKILCSKMKEDTTDYILPWKVIKDELANPRSNAVLNVQYLLEKCYV